MEAWGLMQCIVDLVVPGDPEILFFCTAKEEAHPLVLVTGNNPQHDGGRWLETVSLFYTAEGGQSPPPPPPCAQARTGSGLRSELRHDEAPDCRRKTP